MAQVLGAIAGAGVLFVIASGKAGFDASGGFASNGHSEHSPGGYSLFWLAPILCGSAAGFAYPRLFGDKV